MSKQYNNYGERDQFNIENFNISPSYENSNRKSLLEQVSSQVKLQINSSLGKGVYIALDLTMIRSSCDLKSNLNDQNIINIFDKKDVAGRLLILGQPGAGKTTILLKLAEELVKRANNNHDDSVPVLFSLSSWKNDDQSIRDWLIEQLKEKYGFGEKIGKQWINNQKIIPLLDGLNELASDRQEKCIIKINEFIDPGNWTNPLVVSNRIQESNRYRGLLELNNHLELCLFSDKQVSQYLQNTEHLQLWNIIQHDKHLKDLAKTPFYLKIILHSGQEILTVKRKQFNSSNLFNAYINQLFKNEKPKILKNNKRWLNWLAKRLIEENTTEFLIEKMQPTLLENKFPKVLYNLIVWGIIGALVSGLIGELFLGQIHEPNSREIGHLFIDLINGLINGLILGLILVFFGKPIEKQIKEIKRIKGLISFIKGITYGVILGIINGLILGIINGLINIPFYPHETELINIPFYPDETELINRLINGLILGMVYGLIGENIQPIERLKYTRKKFINVQIYTLASGLFLGLIYDLTTRQTTGLINGVSGLILGLILGMIYGIDGREVVNKTIPNQGIRQSVINTLIISGVSCLLSTLLIFVIKKILKPELSFNLVPSAIIGLLIGILSSGTPAIKHFVLRVILWSSGYIPWNYAKFLDYCTKHRVLQRIGGSYRFMHDQLRQHFAELCTNCGHHNPTNCNFCTNCGTVLIRGAK